MQAHLYTSPTAPYPYPPPALYPMARPDPPPGWQAANRPALHRPAQAPVTAPPIMPRQYTAPPMAAAQRPGQAWGQPPPAAPIPPAHPAPGGPGPGAPAQQPSLVRDRILAALAMVGVIALSLLGSIVSLGSEWNDDTARGLTNPGAQMLELLVSFSLVIALTVRRRAPLTLVLCSAMAGIILGLDTTVGLIASVTLVKHTPRWREHRHRALASYGALAALVIGTAMAVHHDAMRAPRGNSVLGLFLFPAPDPALSRGVIHWPAQALTTCLIVSLPLIIGIILAARGREAHAAAQAARAHAQWVRAEQEAEQATRTTEVLIDQVEMREERERIAHEVHDGLGHRLSLLAMQAGILEASADPATAQAAQAVRQGSQEAMDELRSLLEVLREPSTRASLGDSAPSLAELAGVVDSMVEVGTPLSSSIVLDRPTQASGVLSHAVYRIVQECLTNASKHAPGELIRLRLEGGPETGLRLRCSNRMSQAPADASVEPPGSKPPGNGPGSGLRGMAQRVQICRGVFRAGPSPQGEFVVEADIPWEPGSTPRDQQQS